MTSILKRFGVRRATLFGSAMWGEAGKDSDVDIRVEIGTGAGLINLAKH